MSNAAITLVKSPIDKTKRQKDTLKALGLTKVNQTVTHTLTPQIQGMLKVVEHLVVVSGDKA